MAELESDQLARTRSQGWTTSTVLLALIPLLLLGVLLAVIVVTGAGLGARTAPPIEELTVDRISLPRAIRSSSR